MSTRRWLLVLAGIVIAFAFADLALAQGAQDAAETVTTRTLFDLVLAGGLVGLTIILLSVVGIALVVDGFLRLRPEKLVPPALIERGQELARQDKFADLLSTCKQDNSMFARILAGALSDGTWGLEAVRERMQQEGNREVTRLRQRIGYIGLIASIAPMLGLLGTVVGMITSFKLLGEAKGAARPDELASGISLALVTTCMGLIVAVPLMFFYAYFRDQITRIGQDAAAAGEKLLRIMSVVLDARTAAPQTRARSASMVMPGSTAAPSPGPSFGPSLGPSLGPPIPPVPPPNRPNGAAALKPPAPANGPRPDQPSPAIEPSGA